MAYQEAGFSGEQYVLEKGVYRNCDDWGAGHSALASLQPVLQVRGGGRRPGLREVVLGVWGAPTSALVPGDPAPSCAEGAGPPRRGGANADFKRES